MRLALRSTPTRTTDTGTTTTSAAVTIAAHHTRHSDSTPPSSPCQPLPVVKRVRVLFSAVCTRVCLCARGSRPAYVWMMRTMVRAIHGVCMHTSRPRCSLTHLVMPCSVCARSSVRWDVIIRMGKSVKYVAPFPARSHPSSKEHRTRTPLGRCTHRSASSPGQTCTAVHRWRPPLGRAISAATTPNSEGPNCTRATT